VFLSAGTPMLLAGDEFGRTQGGNNNAYCQDNELSWIDWSLAASPSGAALTAYVGRLIALRQSHDVLRHPEFLHGQSHPAIGIADIEWFDQSADQISVAAWNDSEQRTLILRRSMRIPEGKVTILTLLLNPTDRAVEFRLPPPRLAQRVLLDSAAPEAQERALPDSVLQMAQHSAVLLYAESAE
jgi:glycogen operon protein